MHPSIGHFTVVCLDTWGMTTSEAEGDLALIKISLLFSCKCQLISIRTTWFTQQKQWGLCQNKVISTLAAIQDQVTEKTTVKWWILVVPFSHFFRDEDRHETVSMRVRSDDLHLFKISILIRCSFWPCVELLLGSFTSRWRDFIFLSASLQFLASELSYSCWQVYNFPLASFQILA